MSARKKSKNSKKRAKIVSSTINSVQALRYARANFDTIYNNVKLQNWSALYAIREPNAAAEYFQKTMENLILPCVPHGSHSCSTSNKYPPWFTREVISTITAKERERRKITKSKNTQYDDSRYKYLRALSKKQIRSAHSQYLRTMEGNLATDPKHFWDFIRKNKESRNKTEIMNWDGATLSDPRDIVTKFAEHFSTVYVLDQSIPCLHPDSNAHTQA